MSKGKDDLDTSEKTSPSFADYMASVRAKAEGTLMSSAAALPEEPSQPVVPPSEAIPKPDQSTKVDDGKGGGDGKKNDGNGGGGWFGKFFQNLGFFGRMIFGFLAVLIVALLLNEVNLWYTSRVIKLANDNPIAVSPVTAPPLTSKESTLSTVAPQAQQKTILYATTFSCTNEVDRENGYAMKNIQNLDGNSQSLHVGPGCVLTKVSGNVITLSGHGYRLSVEGPHTPGSFWNCGDMGGSNDTESACVSFINEHSGRQMRIAVLNGGYVKLN